MIHPSLVPMYPSEAVLRQMTTNDVIFEEDITSENGSGSYTALEEIYEDEEDNASETQKKT